MHDFLKWFLCTKVDVSIWVSVCLHFCYWCFSFSVSLWWRLPLLFIPLTSNHQQFTKLFQNIVQIAIFFGVYSAILSLLALLFLKVLMTVGHHFTHTVLMWPESSSMPMRNCAYVYNVTWLFTIRTAIKMVLTSGSV